MKIIKPPELKDEIKSFRKFAFKGRMTEMAVAFMIGAAFQKAVEAISSFLIMPFVNFLISQTGTSWRAITYIPVDGLVLEVGKFLGAFVDFLLIAIILYVIYVKLLKPLFEDESEEQKVCPNCQQKISPAAKRCCYCTSWLSNE